jgi:hypothetical protein
VLHAIRADGTEAWSRDVGSGAALTTAAVTSDGWLYVGRSDGYLVALVEAATRGLPAEPGGVLLAARTGDPREAALAWPDVALPAAPGAHYHLRRWEGWPPVGPGTHVLAPHAFATRAFTDATDARLAFYDLRVADCGENEPAR